MTQLPFGVRFLVVVLIVGAFFLSLPNALSPANRDKLPGFLPHGAMSLGLDLQGGAHLVLEVNLPDVWQRAYDNVADEFRTRAREAKVGYTGLRATADGVTLTLREPASADKILSDLRRDGIEAQAGANGTTTLVFGETRKAEMQKRAVAQTLQVLRGRVDEFGVAEPLLQQQGDRRVIVELPGVKDVGRAKAAIGRTAQLTFHMVDETSDGTAPVIGDKLKLNEDVTDDTGKVVGQRPLVVDRRPALTGDLLTNAGATSDQFGAPAVDIAFDSRGTRIFADISTQNVGKRFAIVLDGKVVSAPVFREPILGGRAQISGHFTQAEAQDLAAILNAGALPASVSVVEERTVGPTLGADSVAAGEKAMFFGTLAVLVFMVLFYGLFGAIANLALMVNLMLLVAAMTLFGFTLTLPGMAGIVLTLGMAVDANVLIFERIREETKNGLRPLAALLRGFERAFSIILDGHVTTLVAAFALFLVGTGPIKGFSVALIIGLSASLFTSVTLTRWICLAWIRRARPNSLPI
ncbi:MAG TPA: protein translocase subunit SecD [Alphaproteobacteria bacterium]|nr:protein translocase subunit SecD [Alphaproteobacteria bacterium]